MFFLNDSSGMWREHQNQRMMSTSTQGECTATAADPSTEIIANLGVLEELWSTSRNKSIRTDSELARLSSEATLRKPATAGRLE